MSGDERARIDRAVETAGLSRSEWIRRRCEATTDDEYWLHTVTSGARTWDETTCFRDHALSELEPSMSIAV